MIDLQNLLNNIHYPYFLFRYNQNQQLKIDKNKVPQCLVDHFNYIYSKNKHNNFIRYEIFFEIIIL